MKLRNQSTFGQNKAFNQQEQKHSLLQQQNTQFEHDHLLIRLTEQM